MPAMMYAEFEIVCCFWNCIPHKTSIFRVKIVPQNAFFGLNFPPWCSVQVCVRTHTDTTVISFISSTYYAPSMREGSVWPFPILLKPSWHSFIKINKKLKSKNGLQLAVNVKSMRYISIFCKTVVLFISLYQTLFKYCNIRTCETELPRKAY